MRRTPALLLLAVLALSACVGPRYRRPQVVTPPAWKEAGDWKLAEPNDAAPRGHWWSVYGDPQLDGLMQQVEISNQNVRTYAARFDQAMALLGQSRAGLLPTLGASASSTRSQNGLAGLSNGVGAISTGGTGGSGGSGGAGGTGATGSGGGAISTGGGGTRTVDRFALSLSWQLDLWGNIRNTVAANRASAQASAGDLAGALLSAQSTLAQSYFQLRVTDLNLQLLEGVTQAYGKALEITQNRYKAGVAQRSDVTQAQSQLESARAQALDLSITRATLEHAIAVLVGKAPAELGIERNDHLPEIPDIPLTLPAQLLERRPDIAAAERRMAAANARIGVATSAYFPTLTLSGTGGYSNAGWAHLLSLPNRFWSVGPSLAETLFDAGARGFQRAQAKALYEESVATYRQTVLTAFQAVEDDLVTLRMLRQEALAERAAADAAAQTLAIVQNQYKAGTVDYLNVATAQTASLNAERAWRDIMSRALVASAGLAASLGGGWEAQQLKP